MTASDAWWLDFYDDDVARHLLARGDGAALAATADFLWNRLDLHPGAVVFDQCCGVGDVGLELARRGASLFGVDAAAKYVDAARSAAAARGAAAEFWAADARAFRTPRPCDAAFNWWTSFGGAGSRREDLRMLERVRDSLRPGGRFALETLHAPGVWRNFQPTLSKRFSTPQGDVLLVRECELHPAQGRMSQRWSWFHPDGACRERRSSLRLYTPPELADMLVEAGLAPREVLADPSGAPLGLDSERCILLAERPATDEGSG